MRLWLAPHLAHLVKTLRILGLDTRLWRRGRTGWTEEDRIIQQERYPLPVRGVTVITLKTEFELSQVREILKALKSPPRSLETVRSVPALQLAFNPPFLGGSGPLPPGNTGLCPADPTPFPAVFRVRPPILAGDPRPEHAAPLGGMGDNLIMDLLQNLSGTETRIFTKPSSRRTPGSRVVKGLNGPGPRRSPG